MALTKIDDRGLKTPIDLLDNEKIRFGTGNDLDIFHDSGSTKSMINNQNGELRIVCDNAIRIGKRHDATIAYADNMIVANPDGSVDLYYDNSKKLFTQSWGVEITGTVKPDQLDLDDNHLIRLGNSADLQLYHNGSNSYIDHDGAGDFYIRAESSGENIYIKAAAGIYLHALSSESGIDIVENGAVNLYWDGSKKFETTSTGATISGGLICQDTSEFQVVLKDSNHTGSAAEAAIGFKGNDDATLGLVGFNYWGDGNLDIQNNFSGGIIAFETHNGTAVGERVRLTSDGKLWVATTEDNTGSSIVGRCSSGYSIAAIKDSTGAALAFGGVTQPRAVIEAKHDASTLQFHTAAGSTWGSPSWTNRMEIESNGNVKITDGNLYIGTAGHGIDFSAQTASSATGATSGAELFDHYEEGTWTPILNKVSVSGTITASYTRYANYVRIGKMLWISFYIQINSSSWGTGNDQWYISGLPFGLESSTSGAYQYIPIGYFGLDGAEVNQTTEQARLQANNQGGNPATLTMYGTGRNTNWTTSHFWLSASGFLEVQ